MDYMDKRPSRMEGQFNSLMLGGAGKKHMGNEGGMPGALSSCLRVIYYPINILS